MADSPEDELELVYIAARLEEAQAVEELLETAEVDYEVRVEQYKSGVLFASVRAGAFFYVLRAAAAGCREMLRQRGYQAQEAAPE